MSNYLRGDEKLLLKDTKYKYDQYVLKVFGYGENKRIKLIHMNVLRNEGVEDDNDKGKVRGVNSEKLEESICRTRSKIFELAFCNPWSWFFTGTLDPKKYDRTDLKKFHSDLTNWLRQYNRYHGTQVKFLLIPELHTDGKSWHMHGFFYDLPQEHLTRFQIGDRMGKALAEKVKNGDEVFNWSAYQKKFGFCDLEPIRNAEAVSKYITKYISKNLATSVTELNAHMYYHSRGLQFAQTVKKGSMSTAIDIEPTYSNEYCDVYWLPYSSELLQELSDGFV